MSVSKWKKLDLVSNDGSEQQPDSDFFTALDGAVKEAGLSGQEEGQLCVDVAQTADELVVIATMAGTPPEKLELHLHNDLLTIRGERRSAMPNESEYFHQEIFWGKFSRSIVLPVDVKHELTKAEYKNGILTVHLPKVQSGKSIPIVIVEE